MPYCPVRPPMRISSESLQSETPKPVLTHWSGFDKPMQSDLKNLQPHCENRTCPYQLCEGAYNLGFRSRRSSRASAPVRTQGR